MGDDQLIQVLQERGGSWRELFLVGDPPIISRWSQEGLSSLVIEDDVLWRECVGFLRRQGARSFQTPEEAQRTFAPADPPANGDGSCIWSWEGRGLAKFFGIGLLLWPFLSFGAIFIFDSPTQSRSDELNRYTVAYFIWFYPVTYAVTCLLYYILRRCGVWRLVSCFAWGLPAVAYFILPAITGWRDVERANSKRVQMLYRTDHAALLAACREVMIHRNTFATEGDRHGTGDSSRSLIDPKDPKLPAVIVALQPRHIVAEDTGVFLELHGGLDYFGVMAYAEKAASSHTNGWSEEFLLTPGLWFHDVELGYRGTDRTEYINKLRAMRPADAAAPKW